ncbi:MAG: hypothetical protein ACRD4Y_12765, partial [Candidatus Acidiferrales bacterium]
MTTTIKDSPETAGMPKPGPASSGSASQDAKTAPAPSARSNPVCLEVPISLRSLPGEGVNSASVAIPSRQEGRSVIVFDTGGVLRVPRPLPPGQKAILSNQHGRDVVCRVVAGRNLPSVKGYIEVEFFEPVADFWNIHQVPVQTVASAPASPAVPPTVASALQPLQALPPQPEPAQPPPAIPAPPLTPLPEKESNPARGEAPSFDDIAGLVPTASQAAAHSRTADTPVAVSFPKSEEKPAPRLADAASKGASSAHTAAPASEFDLEKFVTPPVQEPHSSRPPREPFSGNFAGKGLQFPTAASASTSGEPRSRLLLILGGSSLLFAALGGGYFFLHRGKTPSPAQPGALASQPPAPPSADTGSSAQISPTPEATVNQAPLDAAAPSESPALPPAEASASAPSESRAVRGKANRTEGRQPDRAPVRIQAIPNLKLSAPLAPGKPDGQQRDASLAGGAVIQPTPTEP